jgi:hypothetical protein
MWVIDRTAEIGEWVASLDEDAREAILKNLIVLREIGPSLGRPYADTIKQSRHRNMKELRVQSKKRVYRLFYIFDIERKAVLLIGGDKRGDKIFYKRMIPIADRLYDEYLLKKEGRHGQNKKERK